MILVPRYLIAPLVLSVVAGSRPATARIALPTHAPGCVTWAAGDLRAALQEASINPDSASVSVAIHPGPAPESYSLHKRGPAVTIAGSDAVGTMYGLFELTEQIRNGGALGSWRAVAVSLHDTDEHPFVQFRADNAFIPASNYSLHFDVPMWKAYIDNLARNRYNALDLHGGYDYTTTGFPNLYPLLVHVPEYPEVGNPEQQARNLADFRAIVQYGQQRGVQVSFMNYSAGVPIIPKEKLADYTARAVAALLTAVPELKMLGFRIGESGQPATFFQDAYIHGLALSGRKDIGLYTRTWGATQPQIEGIAAANGGLDLEIKYNGEHLGLPYHAILDGHKDYSYQGYIQPHASYRIIWQVRANGTHRFWTWEDTDFIRRTVLTFPLGHAHGFTLEPPIAYFSPYARDYYRSAADRDVDPYIWQKWWMWYFAWGRLSYDPHLPESTIVAAYRHHYGSQGPAIYRAMQSNGWIVPLAFAYRYPGPDQRDFSPETETGATNYHASSEKTFDVLSFGRNTPMDHRSFVGVDEYVREQIAGTPDGRPGPEEMADLFRRAADDTRQKVAAVGPIQGHARDEWRLLRTDLLGASSLGDYYSDRIRGVMLLDYALRSGSQADYDAAGRLLTGSRDDWKRLADTLDPVYLPLNNSLRHQPAFQWANELASLDRLDASLPDLWAGARPDPAAKPWRVDPRNPEIYVSALRHQWIQANQVSITVKAGAPAGVQRVLLWTKPLPSEARWHPETMAAGSDGSFTATVTPPREGMLYMVEVIDQRNGAVNYPSVLKERPYHVISPDEVETHAHPGPIPAGTAAGLISSSR